jgi:hypothetical protein
MAIADQIEGSGIRELREVSTGPWLLSPSVGRQKTGREAGAAYLRALKPLLGILEALGALKVRQEETAPVDAWALAIKEAYERT